MRIVFLVEEASAKELLDILLPKILSEHTEFLVIAHQGYGDLRKSIPVKLKSWKGDDTHFVILHDQDNRDCVKLKRELEELCRPYRRSVLIRIICKELESWYFGDLAALESAYGKKLRHLTKKSAYRNPDEIFNPKGELKKILPEHQQISGARRIAPHMEISSNISKSFCVFINGIRRLEDSFQKYSERNSHSTL